LRGRFVLSSGQGSGLTNRTIGQTGGLQAVTLDKTHMPKHSHGGATTSSDSTNNGSHTHTATDSGHYHQQSSSTHGGDYGSSWFRSRRDDGHYTAVLNTETSYANITVNSTNSTHNHKIAEDGSDLPHENMPPFYVLAFIMRVS